jgi:hypothetical protein
MAAAPRVVRQIDLAKLERMRAEARRTVREFKKMRDAIMAELQRGAEVEEGPYRVELRICARLAIE